MYAGGGSVQGGGGGRIVQWILPRGKEQTEHSSFVVDSGVLLSSVGMLSPACAGLSPALGGGGGYVSKVSTVTKSSDEPALVVQHHHRVFLMMHRCLFFNLFLRRRQR